MAPKPPPLRMDLADLSQGWHALLHTGISRAALLCAHSHGIPLGSNGAGYGGLGVWGWASSCGTSESLANAPAVSCGERRLSAARSASSSLARGGGWSAVLGAADGSTSRSGCEAVVVVVAVVVAVAVAVVVVAAVVA